MYHGHAQHCKALACMSVQESTNHLEENPNPETAASSGQRFTGELFTSHLYVFGEVLELLRSAHALFKACAVPHPHLEDGLCRVELFVAWATASMLRIIAIRLVIVVVGDADAS